MKKCKNTNKEKDDDVNADDDSEDLDDEYEEVTMLTNYFLFTSPISVPERLVHRFSVNLMCCVAGCK